MKILKKCLPDVLAIVLFIAISMAYFIGPVTSGKILYRHDSSAGVGAGREASLYHEETGETTRWTNSLFSGMPTYQMSPSYDSTDGLSAVMKAYHLWLPENVWFLFVYLLGFYIMLRAFDFRQHLAVLGSVIWAFSSYFLIIIAAGHLWKVFALAYLPPMIGGVVLAYRSKYLWGFIVTALFAAFEVKANHVQMTYYYLFIIAFMVLAFLAEAIRERALSRWLKATGICAAAAVIGIAINASNLYHTWEYSKESMRGKSELIKKNTANQTDSGLERSYITQWSYGIDETWTLLVPNTKGGASMPIASDATAMSKADPQVIEAFEQVFQMNPYEGFSEYWGTQPGTSGPVYVGAFVLLLFVLGLFIVKGPMKWALLAATILSILLSWGKNFMGLTDFFIDHVPMYSKFRTVASILVIAEFTIPLLAMLALKKIIDEPDLLGKKSKLLWVAFALTGGVCLLFAVLPDMFFNFDSANDAQTIQSMSKQIMDALASYDDMKAEFQQLLPRLQASLSDMHRAVFTADCWRSLVIILLGMAMLLLYRAKKLPAKWMIAGVFVLCLFDMWQVDKRYLNDGMFVPKSVREAPQQMTKADEYILEDKTPDYRVLNLTRDTFNENETSYYHKSIGGYHAAKLRRYQELIERYISPEMRNLSKAQLTQVGDQLHVTDDQHLFPVLSMLNTKYFIVDTESRPVLNASAMGNAWFVDRVIYVDNANQELDRLGKMDIQHEAVADKKFQSQLGQSRKNDSTATVRLDKYLPNSLSYTVESQTGGVVVFSEIYYPGWTATIDGQPAELGRVNYVLRALNVKPGKHQVVLNFHPSSVKTTETIAYIASTLLVVAILTGAFFYYRRQKKLP